MLRHNQQFGNVVINTVVPLKCVVMCRCQPDKCLMSTGLAVPKHEWDEVEFKWLHDARNFAQMLAHARYKDVKIEYREWKPCLKCTFYHLHECGSKGYQAEAFALEGT